MCAVCDALFGNDDNQLNDGAVPSEPVLVPSPRQPTDEALPAQPGADEFEAMIAQAVEELLSGLGQTTKAAAPTPEPSRTASLSVPSGDDDEMPSQNGLVELLDLGVSVFGLEQMISLATLLMSAKENEELVLDVRLRKVGEKETVPYDAAADVRQFNKAAGQKSVVELDDWERQNLISLRRDLHEEEQEEVENELYELQYNMGSRIKLAKELADAHIINYGTAGAFEIDLDAVVEAVMKKNWEKINPANGHPYVVLENGKVGKPYGFVDLTEDEIEAIIG